MFDSTILSIVIAGLTWSYDTVDPAGNRHISCVFLTGNDALDTNDFQVPLADSVGPAWMGTLWSSERNTGVQAQTQQLVPPEGMRFKSKRRFRENNETLFMVVQSFAPHNNDTNLTLDGMVRTLIRIP